MVGLVALALLGLGGFWILTLNGSKEQGGWSDPDYTRVFNGFQQASSAIVGNGGVGSVEPDSECKLIDDTTWRCYRRWAPVGHPEKAELLQGDVDVYQDRVVVGPVSRTPDADR